MTTSKEALRLKQTRGAGIGLAKQVGLTNGLLTAAKSIYLSKVKGVNKGQAFFSSYWQTLGDREAIVCEGDTVTFKQFRDRVLRLANGLTDLGVPTGARVAELLPNCVEWFEVNLATAMSGRTMPMLNWHLKPKEIVACVNKAEAIVLVIDPSYLDVIDSIKQEFKTVEHILVLGDNVPEGYVSYEKLIAKSKCEIPIGSFGMSPTPYSGGTTGTPKLLNSDEMGAVLSDDSDDRRRGATKDQAKAMTIMQVGAFHWYEIGQCKDSKTKNIRTLVPGPLYHAGVQIAVLPFFLGGTAVVMKKFSAEEFLKLIQDQRINWTFVAPTMLERVLALPAEVKSKYDLSTMNSLICAAAPCPPQVKRDINALFRAQGNKKDIFMEYYGASETGLVSVLVPEDYQQKDNRYNSVGKTRAAQCRIFDVENDVWAKTGEEGRVLVRSAMALGLQYKGDKAKTEEAFRVIEGITWYDDGLIGYIDEDEFLYLTSRAKEMIICGGVNLFPNEIENVIKQHPSVFDVAVIRAPDEDLGEVPAAIIQLMDGEVLSAEEVLQFCKQEGLYGFKIPKIVDFEKELPRQLSGKLIKRQLEEKYWKGVESFG
ncbi:MAG: AMP-binding protein [Pseudomonadales bacterium]|nr:AMP-binding protein [Pseudomonadales bacterium]